MRILYRFEEEDKSVSHLFCEMGVTRVFVKYIDFSHHSNDFTIKRHYHTDFEIHFMLSGEQVYEIGDMKTTLKEGHFLLLSPLLQHRVMRVSSDAKKYAICFRCADKLAFEAGSLLTGKTPIRAQNALSAISEERNGCYLFSQTMITARVAECIALFLRMIANADHLAATTETGEDPRVLVAKQFIEDNVTSALTISDVAAVTHLSEKQLSRIFKDSTGKTVADFIRENRIKRIEKLLLETPLSLSEISNIMHFGNEYYFNRFYKAHTGMTPGAFRRSMTKK